MQPSCFALLRSTGDHGPERGSGAADELNFCPKGPKTFFLGQSLPQLLCSQDITRARRPMPLLKEGKFTEFNPAALLHRAALEQ